MYSSTSVQLILINDTTKQDDKVSIRKNLTYNEFDVSYLENSPSELPQLHRVTGLSHQAVLDYVHLLLKSQYLDEEPYSKIQINVPAMPRVILSAAKFHDMYQREHVYDMISAGMDYLEAVEVTVPTKKAAKITKIPSLRKAIKKCVVSHKNVDTLPVSESEGEIADQSEGCDYYLGCNDEMKACMKHGWGRLGSGSGVRQHLYWDDGEKV